MKLWIGGIVIASLSIVLLTFHVWLTAIAKWLIVGDQVTSADVIAVSTGSLERIEFAIRLWEQGVAPKIFVLTSDWLVPGIRKSIGELVQDEMLLRGISPDALFIHHQSGSTYEDALYSKECALRLGVTSLIVLEDPFGMRRLRWTFKKVFADTDIKLWYVAVPPELSDLKLDTWWTREQELLYVFEEYVKLIMYWIKY